jgi:hypothetical protein
MDVGVNVGVGGASLGVEVRGIGIMVDMGVGGENVGVEVRGIGTMVDMGVGVEVSSHAFQSIVTSL